MKLSRAHLSVLGAAAKAKDLRPLFNSIYTYKDDGETVAVATDSYRLYEVREATLEDDLDNHDLIIPVDEVKLAQTLLKSNQHLTHIEATADQISVNGTTHKISVREGKFPEYKKIIPTVEPVAEIKLNPAYLKEAMDFFKDAGGGVTVKFYGATQPVVITNDAEKLALIMPLRG
jgi:DNA polymerase III sliding clamp (beta) subunit (PCNA family)